MGKKIHFPYFYFSDQKSGSDNNLGGTDGTWPTKKKKEQKQKFYKKDFLKNI